MSLELSAVDLNSALTSGLRIGSGATLTIPEGTPTVPKSGGFLSGLTSVLDIAKQGYATYATIQQQMAGTKTTVPQMQIIAPTSAALGSQAAGTNNAAVPPNAVTLGTQAGAQASQSMLGGSINSTFILIAIGVLAFALIISSRR